MQDANTNSCNCHFGKMMLFVIFQIISHDNRLVRPLRRIKSFQF